MNSGIKAIETRYNGYRFRSRLEARWAVFFDSLDIRYEYEPEGYELPSGWYLPDFYLPDYKAWVEIKGEKPSHISKQLAHELSITTGKHTLMIIGTPGVTSIDKYLDHVEYFCPDWEGIFSYSITLFMGTASNAWPNGSYFYSILEPSYLCALREWLYECGFRTPDPDGTLTTICRISKIYQQCLLQSGHARPLYDCGLTLVEAHFSDHNGYFSIALDFDDRYIQSTRLINAYTAARSARFEFEDMRP